MIFQAGTPSFLVHEFVPIAHKQSPRELYPLKIHPDSNCKSNQPPYIWVACTIMKHKTAANYSAKEISLANGDDLVISMDDYVRLREIVGDHDLADELDRAIVVPSDRIPRDVVTMNSRLIYADESAGTRREVELVFPNEADPLTGRVSVLAPVGCALLGLRVGQSIDWNLPNGHVHRLRVERVLRQPQSVNPQPEIARTS